MLVFVDLLTIRLKVHLHLLQSMVPLVCVAGDVNNSNLIISLRMAFAHRNATKGYILRRFAYLFVSIVEKVYEHTLIVANLSYCPIFCIQLLYKDI